MGHACINIHQVPLSTFGFRAAHANAQPPNKTLTTLAAGFSHVEQRHFAVHISCTAKRSARPALASCHTRAYGQKGARTSLQTVIYACLQLILTVIYASRIVLQCATRAVAPAGHARERMHHGGQSDDACGGAQK